MEEQNALGYFLEEIYKRFKAQFDAAGIVYSDFATIDDIGSQRLEMERHMGT